MGSAPPARVARAAAMGCSTHGTHAGPAHRAGEASAFSELAVAIILREVAVLEGRVRRSVAPAGSGCCCRLVWLPHAHVTLPRCLTA